MQFLISSALLLKSLSNINGVVASNPIVPILENFLFRVEPGEQGGILTATASDLQSTMTIQIPVETSERCALAVPAKLLLDTLRSLPEQVITFKVDEETFAVQLITDNGRYKIAGENAIDFPKIPTVNGAFSVELSSEALLDAINNTVFATSTDDLRPAMTGVFVTFTKENAIFAATDGHRLVRYRRTDISVPDEHSAPTSMIIPRKALQLLKASLPDSVAVTTQIGTAQASFTFGDTKLVCRLIDERFPDYENAIPTANDKLLTIGRSDLLNTLKRVNIYANRTTHQIRLSLKGEGGSRLTISAEDLDYSNEANESLLCDYEGDNFEIGFNAKLLVEMLNTMSDKLITLKMSAPNRAALIVPADAEENTDLLMLAMPVMLNTYA